MDADLHCDMESFWYLMIGDVFPAFRNQEKQPRLAVLIHC